MKTWKTPKGTTLSLMDLKGKDYLPVAQRILWFREDHPDWKIVTEFLELSTSHAIAKATILDEDSSVVATAHKIETVEGFRDFIEKAETGAVGRALAFVGYGTQFCGADLDEGDRLADAPLEIASAVVPPISGQAVARKVIQDIQSNAKSIQPKPAFSVPLEVAKRYVVKFGKYKNQSLGIIEPGTLAGYVEYLLKQEKPSKDALELVEMARVVIKNKPEQEEIDEILGTEPPWPSNMTEPHFDSAEDLTI